MLEFFIDVHTYTLLSSLDTILANHRMDPELDLLPARDG
jgi:hypothetical protein